MSGCMHCSQSVAICASLHLMQQWLNNIVHNVGSKRLLNADCMYLGVRHFGQNDLCGVTLSFISTPSKLDRIKSFFPAVVWHIFSAWLMRI